MARWGGGEDCAESWEGGTELLVGVVHTTPHPRGKNTLATRGTWPSNAQGILRSTERTAMLRDLGYMYHFRAERSSALPQGS